MYEGGAADDDVDKQGEGAEARAALGLGSLGQTVAITQRFDEALLKRVLDFDAKDRSTAFTKELRDAPSMQKDISLNAEGSDKRRSELAATLQSYEQGLRAAAADISSLIDMQRQHFQQKEGEVIEGDDPTEDRDAPPPLHESKPDQHSPPVAFFAPCDQWRRPSDFLAHQLELFEKGDTTPPGKKKITKRVTKDQLLFLAQFAAALNQVWDDEQNDVPMSQRERFSFLLMGQGGSGKTAIVQEVVLPTMDFVFPPDDYGQKSSLIVCSSWAQAENISNQEHRAMSCHKAGQIRVQSMRNRDMLPGEKRMDLEKMWTSRRLLVLEEVGMISPALYNMLLYRSFHGRTSKYEVPESLYDKLAGAFGRTPLVLHLGDFLQLRPTSAFSLLDDFKKIDPKKDVPAEHQQAAKLFMETPLCFELVITNRFKDVRLKRLMEFMRHPARKVPKDISDF